MTKQTPERKQLKTELARKFQKATQDGLAAFGVTRSKQWGLARRAVNHAEKTAPNASDASLKKTFAKVLKKELKALDNVQVQAVEAAYTLGRISRSQAGHERIDLTPRPQPPTVNFPPSNSPYRY